MSQRKRGSDGPGPRLPLRTGLAALTVVSAVVVVVGVAARPAASSSAVPAAATPAPSSTATSVAAPAGAAPASAAAPAPAARGTTTTAASRGKSRGAAGFDIPAATTIFPAAAVVDVRRYGARGDGRHDDTAALQRAVRENHGRMLFLRPGTYLVSDTIEGVDAGGRWQPYTILRGQNRDQVTIKLVKGARGFGNPAQPKAVLSPSSGAFVDPKPLGGGAGNEAFGNYVENLTVDTGSNRGAVGIAYEASNYGAIRDVTVTGAGVAGVDMTRALFGPALVKNLTVKGFDVGVDALASEYGATMEHVRLIGQRVAGLRDRGGSLAVRDLQSRNRVPALVVDSNIAQVSLLDARLTGGSPGASAIVLTQQTSGLLAENVRGAGYRALISHAGHRVGTTSLRQWTSSPVQKPFGGSGLSLDLPVRETPTFHDNNPRHWANVENYGAHPHDWVDDTAAIQRAIDSGASTVFLPTGEYMVSGTLHVRGAVRRFVGMNSTLYPINAAFSDPAHPRAVFRIEDGAKAGVVIDRLYVGKRITNLSQAGLIGFEHVSARPLTLTDGGCCGERGLLTVKGGPTAGPEYVEDYSADVWQLHRGQRFWARQLNPEGTVRRITNAGGTAWILGLKIEGGASTLETTAGGCSELLGSTLYVFGGLSGVVPYLNVDSSMSVSGVTTAFGQDDYRVHVREVRRGVTRDVARDRLAWRGDGRAMPLYTSGSRSSCATPALP